MPIVSFRTTSEIIIRKNIDELFPLSIYMAANIKSMSNNIVNLVSPLKLIDSYKKIFLAVKDMRRKLDIIISGQGFSMFWTIMNDNTTAKDI